MFSFCLFIVVKKGSDLSQRKIEMLSLNPHNYYNIKLIVIEGDSGGIIYMPNG